MQNFTDDIRVNGRSNYFEIIKNDVINLASENMEQIENIVWW